MSKPGPGYHTLSWLYSTVDENLRSYIMVIKKQRNADSGAPFEDVLSAIRQNHQPPFHRDYEEADIIRLSAFFRNNPVPILVFSPEGSIIRVNPAANRLLKRLNIPEANLLPTNHNRIVDDCVQGYCREQSVEVTIANRTFALTYHALTSYRMVYLYAIDITDYRRAEDEFLQIASNTLDLVKLAVLRLHSLRRPPQRESGCASVPTVPQRSGWVPQAPATELFVAMDGCVFSSDCYAAPF